MRNNSLKIWSLTLALLLASSYLAAAALPVVTQNAKKGYAARDGKLEFDPETGRAYLELRAAGGQKRVHQ